MTPEVLELIRAHGRILCVSHVAPDGDAVGSLLGMGWILERLGKSPILALPDPPPANFDFLQGFDRIQTGPSIPGDPELIICLDASSPDRMGEIYRPPIHQHLPLLVIDHHVTNTRFGSVNWVDPGCAATCQMLIPLADALGVSVDGDLAWALLTGVVTDTRGFRTGNTDPQVMAAAMRLMQGGADLAKIVENTLNRQPFRVLQLWGHVLPHVRLEEGVIWATITWEAQNAVGEFREDGSLSSRLITAEEAAVSATFTEIRQKDGSPAVICSFRAKPGYDVSGLAFSHGGGGHPPAAGCTLPGGPDHVVPQIVSQLQALVRRSS